MADDDPRPSSLQILGGFILAPPVASVAYAACTFRAQSLTSPALEFTFLICITAYALAMLLGFPAYLILRRVMRPSLWAAGLAGGFVAALPFSFVVATYNSQHAMNRSDAMFIAGVFMAGVLGGAVFYVVVSWRPGALSRLKTHLAK